MCVPFEPRECLITTLQQAHQLICSNYNDTRYSISILNADLYNTFNERQKKDLNIQK